MTQDEILEGMARTLAANGYAVSKPSGAAVTPPAPVYIHERDHADYPYVSRLVRIPAPQLRIHPNPDTVVWAALSQDLHMSAATIRACISAKRLVLIASHSRHTDTMNIMVTRCRDGKQPDIPALLLQQHTDVIHIAPPPPRHDVELDEKMFEACVRAGQRARP